MTYLQLSTVYGALDHLDLGGIAIGWFASGTGAAGLVGAGLWWLLRGLGVRVGLLICSVSPGSILIATEREANRAGGARRSSRW